MKKQSSHTPLYTHHTPGQFSFVYRCVFSLARDLLYLAAAASDVDRSSWLPVSRVEVEHGFTDHGNVLVKRDQDYDHISRGVYTRSVWTRHIRHLGVVQWVGGGDNRLFHVIAQED